MLPLVEHSLRDAVFNLTRPLGSAAFPPRVVAQFGSALALGASGWGFKSLLPDFGRYGCVDGNWS